MAGRAGGFIDGLGRPHNIFMGPLFLAGICFDSLVISIHLNRHLTLPESSLCLTPLKLLTFRLFQSHYSFNLKRKFGGFFWWSGWVSGGERRRVGSRGLCAERVWESLCIPVKLQARQAPSLPFSPPPQAPLQWPSLSFQSITQPIKERELGVRLNPQHTGKHTHTHIYMHTKTSSKICI